MAKQGFIPTCTAFHTECALAFQKYLKTEKIEVVAYDEYMRWLYGESD